MTAGKNPWEADYQRRGRLWGGSASFIPRLFSSSRVLELGCGNGKIVSSLVQAGCPVTAIDFSSHAALLCRNNCTDPDQAGILVADCRITPFRSESFDVVIASHITGHLSLAERSQLAGEILRLLRPGGTMYFRDFSLEDFRNGRGRETEMGTFTRKNGIATHYFTEREVQNLFSGLAITSLEQHRWEMRIRGTVFPRAEIVAEFNKPA
ncbi:MAG: class I SAM-dependent methyltransferase [Methanoregula sp.]|jgi:SAM-dependent methyltransferase